jgi:3-hydroxyisobutyrate dehydrogenase
MRIGFIGLGNMGGPMALNLMKAGHTLVVYDVRRESAKAHLDGGATWAESPKAVARAGELIITSLPGPADVEAVALGSPDGIIHGAQPGSIFADLSTNSPTVMRKLHAAFKQKGVHVLDAPVSGGVLGAQRGTLQVMVGGDEGVFNEVKDVLSAVGNNVSYMGAIGGGSIAKLVHNMVSILSRSLLAEGFTLGVKAGVKPEALLEALRGASFGQGMSLKHHLPDIVFKGDFDTVRFGLKLARKDVGLATSVAREFDVPMPMAAVGEQILVEAMARGWGDKDAMAAWMLQEEAAGVTVRSTQ